jgi:hypothetical protein
MKSNRLPAKRFRRAVDQELLPPAGAQVYGLAAPRLLFRSRLRHRSPASTQLLHIIVMTL